MHYIYALKSKKDGNLYIGCTSNLQNRISEHKKGKVKSTKHRLPLELVYYEEYTDKYEAFNQEKRYKTAKGKKEIKSKIKNKQSGVV